MVDPLRIAGFGACMITGYPHEGGGLFEVACALVEKTLSRPVEPQLFSLKGFPAPRAEKYLKSRVCAFNPNYVVIQFGSTDAARPIRAKRHSTATTVSTGSGVVHSPTAFTIARWKIRSLIDIVCKTDPYRSPTAFTIARWQTQSLVGFVWKTDPITSLSAYVIAIEHMVHESISAGITPIVLSPFTFGSRHSLKNAIDYTNALHDLNSRVNGIIFVDCIQLLSNYPKSGLLLNDGIHLSRLAHSLIGEAIGQAIVADIKLASTAEMATASRTHGPDPIQPVAPFDHRDRRIPMTCGSWR
jgi:hypothetical protein